MITAKKAKETEVFFVTDDLSVDSCSLYDHVIKFEDENKLEVEYHEDIEFDEEDNKEIDNSKYRLRYYQVNRRSVLLGDEFDTEEEAEDEIFNRIYNYDFSKTGTDFFYSENECIDYIVDTMQGMLNVDEDVARHIFRKTEIVKKLRHERKEILSDKLDAEYKIRKMYLATAVPAEAETIIIDQEFKDCLKIVSTMNGAAKSAVCESAMKGLLQRNGKQKIESDFWQVFRILKSKSEHI